MVKLYKFDKRQNDWIFYDYGILARINEYLRRGLIVWFH